MNKNRLAPILLGILVFVAAFLGCTPADSNDTATTPSSQTENPSATKPFEDVEISIKEGDTAEDILAELQAKGFLSEQNEAKLFLQAARDHSFQGLFMPAGYYMPLQYQEAGNLDNIIDFLFPEYLGRDYLDYAVEKVYVDMLEDRLHITDAAPTLDKPFVVLELSSEFSYYSSGMAHNCESSVNAGADGKDFHEIPASLLSTGIADFDYLIVVEGTVGEKVGQYTDGSDAYATVTTIRVIDVNARTVTQALTVSVKQPPSTVTNPKDAGARAAATDFEGARKYIMDLAG